MSALAFSPARSLVGRDLPHGWRVTQEVPRNPYSSGGNFSNGYIAESDGGSRAYLKAMDLSPSLGQDDPVRIINALTESFMFERDLLQACRSKRLDRVVTAIDSGKLGNTPSDLVFYLLFELADADVRSRLGDFGRIDAAWNLRTLHQVATALRQLHSLGIAHNDIKPSNVLIYPGRQSKVSDLGRASHRGFLPPHGEFGIAGDKTYAPPELLYGHISPDWCSRRLGCDLYLMGSFVLSLFTGFGMTHLVMSRLEPRLKPGNWRGSYRDVLPFITSVTASVIQDLGSLLKAPYAEGLRRIVGELCSPDPEDRGHPKNNRLTDNRYSVERYVTEFDLLARKAEIGIFR